MSKLDELIKKYCPDGVKFAQIKDFADTNIGLATSVTANKASNGIQLLHNSDIQQNCIVIKKYEYITEKFAKKNIGKLFKLYDIITVHTGDVGTSAVIGPEYVGCIGFTTITTRIKNFKEINPFYLAHYLNSHKCKESITRLTISDRSNLNQKDFERLWIPVPPLPVQEEIVRILDSFTSLTAELTAELTARKQQYEYYRDELLKPQESIPMVTLKEISTSIYRGAGIKRDQVTEDGIPCVRYGEIYTTYNTWFDECVSHTKEEYVSSPKYFEHGDILFAITGESVEDIAKSIAYIGHDKCLAGGDIVVMKHQQNPRYLAHVLNTSIAREQKSKGKVKSKVVHSNVPSIEQIRIPLPSLEVQKHYADVLDNFEQICNDLNIGLPAEIEARQKQYEYYRDKLLTFKPLA